MVKTADKYGPLAPGYSERTYADPLRFHGRRAELVQRLGPELEPGDRVLDLACADAGIAEFLVARGLDYTGVDGNPAMVEAARRRVRGKGRVELGDLNTYRPREPMAATLCFNAIYYAAPRPDFLRLVAGYTEKKLVFDLNPRRFPLDELRSELQDAGFDRLAARPFFVPQRYALPRSAAVVLAAAERFEPVARVLLAFRFTYISAAFRS